MPKKKEGLVTRRSPSISCFQVARLESASTTTALHVMGEGLRRSVMVGLGSWHGEGWWGGKIVNSLLKWQRWQRCDGGGRLNPANRIFVLGSRFKVAQGIGGRGTFQDGNRPPSTSSVTLWGSAWRQRACRFWITTLRRKNEERTEDIPRVKITGLKPLN